MIFDYRNKLMRFHAYLHYRYPNIIPDTKDNRDFHKNHDGIENLRSKIPMAEELRQASLWGVELYGPREMETLYKNFEKLGWAGNAVDIPENDTLEWLKKIRKYGHTGKRNLGIVYRPKEKGHGRDYFSPMPNECDYLRISIEQVTSSLTAVYVHFILKEESSKIYEETLIKDFKTIYRKFNGKKGYSILGASDQKKEAIETARRDRARMVSIWFSENIPGLFTGGSLRDELPTGEIITMKNHDALKDPKEGEYLDVKWAQLLGIERWYDGWVHPKYPDIGLILEEKGSRKKYHSIITLKTKSFPPDDFKFTGSGSDSYNHIASRATDGIAIRLAAFGYLQEIGRRIREAREAVGQASRDRLSLIDTIDRLEAFYRDAIGDPAIAEELASIDENDFDWSCTNFLLKSNRSDDIIQLPSELYNATKIYAGNVYNDGNSARKLFQEFSSTLSTRESINAQKKMERLTIFAIIIAGISLYVSAKK